MMDNQLIDDAADDIATNFILTSTEIELDGIEHQQLVEAIAGLAKTVCNTANQRLTALETALAECQAQAAQLAAGVTPPPPDPNDLWNWDDVVFLDQRNGEKLSDLLYELADDISEAAPDQPHDEPYEGAGYCVCHICQVLAPMARRLEAVYEATAARATGAAEVSDDNRL